jgi:hypothetical protein
MGIEVTTSAQEASANSTLLILRLTILQYFGTAPRLIGTVADYSALYAMLPLIPKNKLK